MVWLGVVGLALASSSNVEAEAHVAASPDVVTAYLSDLPRVAALFPETCAQRWSFEAAEDGAVSSGEVVYRAGWLRRKLTVTYGEIVPGSYVDLDHLGDKGFVTRFQLDASDEGGSLVTMTTFLSPPRWPLVKLYGNQVQPIWRDCHLRTLDALASSLVP